MVRSRWQRFRWGAGTREPGPVRAAGRKASRRRQLASRVPPPSATLASHEAIGADEARVRTGQIAVPCHARDPSKILSIRPSAAGGKVSPSGHGQQHGRNNILCTTMCGVDRAKVVPPLACRPSRAIHSPRVEHFRSARSVPGRPYTVVAAQGCLLRAPDPACRSHLRHKRARDRTSRST